MVDREVPDAVGDLEHHGEDVFLDVTGYILRQSLLQPLLHRSSVPERQDLFPQFPTLLGSDRDLLHLPLFEPVHIRLYPAILVLREEGCAFQLGSAATYDELVVPYNDTDVLQNMLKRQAHTRQRMLVPVLRHRPSEISRPLDTRLASRLYDAIPQALDTTDLCSVCDQLSRRHASLPSWQVHWMLCRAPLTL